VFRLLKSRLLENLLPFFVPLLPQGLTLRNRKVLAAFQRELHKSGLSEPTVERHVRVIAGFAQTTLLAQDPPRGLLELRGADFQAYLQRASDPGVLTSCKRFVRFLLTTERLDYEAVEALQKQLKMLHPGS
jgi:hypothetical protein